jgi:hypothetical protein
VKRSASCSGVRARLRRGWSVTWHLIVSVGELSLWYSLLHHDGTT